MWFYLQVSMFQCALRNKHISTHHLTRPAALPRAWRPSCRHTGQRSSSAWHLTGHQGVRAMSRSRDHPNVAFPFHGNRRKMRLLTWGSPVTPKTLTPEFVDNCPGRVRGCRSEWYWDGFHPGSNEESEADLILLALSRQGGVYVREGL